MKCVMCSCGAEVVTVQRADDGTDDVWLAVWQLPPDPSSWRWRVQMAWRTLRGREVWADQVSLDIEGIKSLRAALTTALVDSIPRRGESA